MLGAPLIERLGGLAFKVDDEPVVLRLEHLSQMIVPMIARLEGGYTPHKERSDQIETFLPTGQQRLGLRLIVAGQLGAGLLQAAKGAFGLGAGRFDPACDVVLRDRLRLEGGVTAFNRERAVEFRRSLAEGACQRQVERYILNRGFGWFLRRGGARRGRARAR